MILNGRTSGIVSAVVVSMTRAKQVALRASEEITEHGSATAAILVIRQDIASGDYPVAFGRFMRQVITVLEGIRLDSGGSNV